MIRIFNKNMDSKEKAYKIAKEQMYDKDSFSQWLGIEVVDLDVGKAVLKMTVRAEMTNGFGIAHGGIAYDWVVCVFVLPALCRPEISCWPGRLASRGGGAQPSPPHGADQPDSGDDFALLCIRGPLRLTRLRGLVLSSQGIENVTICVNFSAKAHGSREAVK